MSHSPSPEIGGKGGGWTAVPEGPARWLWGVFSKSKRQTRPQRGIRADTQPIKLIEMLKQLHKEHIVIHHFNYAYNGFIFLLPYFIIEKSLFHIRILILKSSHQQNYL